MKKDIANNTYKILDGILKCFKENKQKYLFKEDIGKYMSENNIPKDELMFAAIMDKLINDGYIIFLNEPNRYRITIEGEIFEGYIQKLKLIRLHNRNEHIQTLILTYGTGFAGVYGLFEILKWGFHHFHWSLPI